MFEEIIDRWKIANPMTCHRLGIHDYDGQLPDFTDSFLKTRISQLKSDINYLHELGEPEDKFARFEYGLLLSALEQELFERDERKEYLENPLVYVRPLSRIETSYTARNFAPLDMRIKLITQFEQSIPAFLKRALELLQSSLPKAKVEMSIGFLSGIISYFKDNLITFVTQSDDEDLIDEWSVANIEAVEAMDEFHKALLETYLPNSHEKFALGEEKFLKLLEKTEGVKISVDRLLEVGEADLERNYQALVTISKQYADGSIQDFLKEIQADIPNPNELVKEAESTLDRTRQFLIDSGIVSIPTDEQTTVIHTPEFGRGFGFAAMNTPGPFEVPEAAEAYYWITPPDPNWSDERTAQFMTFFNRATLEMVTIHEVWPGHYLQLLYNKQAKSEIAKLFAWSITMIEGWGHYTEQMVYDEGYEPFDRVRLHVGQLIAALVRNVRFIAAVKMHCQGMSVDEAKQLFITKGFMPEPNAEVEANRGTVDPMYLNYTLGKLMILKLREDYKSELRDDYTIRKFHDVLLSFGSPPISVL
ncbi:MAG: DUF885 domain-containing protein, partial [Candidatus Kariarchaeaceae archaeon]